MERPRLRSPGLPAPGAPLALVYALTALFAVCSPAYRPAQTAWLPHLARTPRELTAANVAASMLFNLGFVVGALSAGALVSTTSFLAALWILAGTFAAAMVPLAGVAPDPRPEREPGSDPARELVEGFRTVARDEKLRELTAVVGVLAVVDGAVDVLVVAAALGFLGLGEAGAGQLSAVWGVGCIAGGPAVLRLLGRGRLSAGLTLGSVVLGGSLAAIGLVPAVGVAVAGLVGFGVGYTIVKVAAEALLQRLAADHVLARVFGVVEILSLITFAAGSLAAGLLVDAIGVRSTLLATAAIVPAVTLLRRTQLDDFEAGVPVSGRDYALLRAHPVFAPLPVATIERLAGALEEYRPPGGSSVVTQGEAGDRFYLIVAGEVDAIEDGTFRRTMGPGEGFGEIALLYDVLRTATVKARCGVVLVALRRESFLEALSGQSRSARAAAALADGRTRPPTPHPRSPRAE